MSTVMLEILGNVAHLTINRAEKRNALTQSMWKSIVKFCDELAGNEKIKVMVLSAKGDKAFSAGADIEELTNIIKDKERLIENNQLVQQAQIKLQQLPFATIAQINGDCIGGGMGLALCCDFRIAVNHAKFGITPSKLGLLYSIEDTKRLVSIVGLSKAKELLYLGSIIPAEQAEKWGLLTSIVKPKELQKKVCDQVDNILSVSSYSIAGAKKTLEYVSGTVCHDEEQIRVLFDQSFSNTDFTEGSNAFLEKRKAQFN
jgi:enoyl-CoA hydratase/carnithine racemase